MEHRSNNACNFPSSVFTVFALAMLASIVGCASPDRRPVPSLEDVVRMSTEGKSDDEIITLLVETRAVYPLTSAKIVDLHEQGITTEVLDYMQQAYIAHERRLERLMYADPFWGYPCFGCRYPYPYRWGPPYYVYPY